MVNPKLALLSLLALPLAAQQPPTAAPKITEVMVMLKVKPGVTRDQIRPIMQTEVRDTVKLYLDGKIRQWYSRGDGKGVVFILNCKDVAEAEALMSALPLHKSNLADFEYLALAPLNPLSLLIADPPAAK